MIKKSLFLASILMASTSAFSAERYIITGVEGKKLEKELKGKGFIKKLKYHKGAVALLNENSINGLKNKFGKDIKVIKDIPVRMNPKPDKPGRGGDDGGDTSSPEQVVPWGISAVKATDAFSINKGAGATVCVVDTGIDKDHPDLVDNIIGGENFVVKKGRVDSNGWDDDNDHGTHVAGTIAALDNSIGVVGVAPEASLFGVKVLDRRGSGYT